MKALKICSILTAAVIASSAFSSSIAQTFSSQGKNENNISPRQKLVIELLRAEIKDNPEFKGFEQEINTQLDSASQRDSVNNGECYKFMPLLVEAVNSNAKFIKLFDIPGRVLYEFRETKNNEKVTKLFSFYERYEDNEFLDLISIVDIEGRTNNNMDFEESANYIINNYCKPLNKILDQNNDMPVPQLLDVLRQRFTK